MTQPNALERQTATPTPQRYAPMGPSGLAFENGGDLWQIAGWVAKAGICPDALRGKQADVFTVMAAGLEMGFGAVASLSLIYIVKGRPSLGYEGCLAKMQSHPEMEYCRIRHEGKGDERCAVIETKRKSRREPNEPIRFSVADARQALLYDEKWRDRNGEPSVWVKYTDDQLVAKVVARSKRRDWPDILPGLQVREDIEEPREERNITPQRERPAAPPVDPARALLGPAPFAVAAGTGREWSYLKTEAEQAETSAAEAPDQGPGAESGAGEAPARPPQGRTLTLDDLEEAVKKRVAAERAANPRWPAIAGSKAIWSVIERDWPGLLMDDERLEEVINEVPNLEVEL